MRSATAPRVCACIFLDLCSRPVSTVPFPGIVPTASVDTYVVDKTGITSQREIIIERAYSTTTQFRPFCFAVYIAASAASINALCVLKTGRYRLTPILTVSA